MWKTINLSRDSCTIGKGRDHVSLGLKRAKKIHGSCVLRQLKRRKEYFKVVMKKLLVTHEVVQLSNVYVVIGSHLGRDKTTHKITSRFYWGHKMYEEIYEYIK